MTKHSYFVALFLLSGFSSLAIAEDLASIAQQNIRGVMAKVDKIDSESLKALLDRNQDLVLLDVRTPTEIKNMGKIDAIALVYNMSTLDSGIFGPRKLEK